MNKRKFTLQSFPIKLPGSHTCVLTHKDTLCI